MLSGLNELNEICQRISKSEDIFQNHIYWNLIFEHVFPPYILEQEPGLVGLPAVTTVPEINVRHLSIKDSLIDSAVMESVTAYKGEHLRFSINNRDAYPPDSRVNWIVRNQGAAAKNINDLGHIQTLDLDSIDHENCEYAGVHILECQVIQNFRIVGFGTLKVTIHGYARPVRNPPKKAIFKGF